MKRIKCAYFFMLIMTFYLLIAINKSIDYQRINFLFIFPIKGNRGPSSLASSYVSTINILAKENIYKRFFNFTILPNIPFTIFKNFVRNKNNVIWFLYSDYFGELYKNGSFTKNMNIVYGPTVSPLRWYKFPLKKTYEVNWSYSISKLLGYVVQSERVKRHLIIHSQRLPNIEKRYIISNGCIVANATNSILPWKERSYDVLVYAKFADVRKENELQMLLEGLKIYSVILIRYGNHTKDSLLYYSNICKIVIYFSFYDCWPSSLMEMVSKGVYPIVQQCEFIGHLGCCIRRFDRNIKKIIKSVNELINNGLNSKSISDYYNEKNNCKKILKKTLLELYYRKTGKKLII